MSSMGSEYKVPERSTLIRRRWRSVGLYALISAIFVAVMYACGFYWDGDVLVDGRVPELFYTRPVLVLSLFLVASAVIAALIGRMGVFRWTWKRSCNFHPPAFFAIIMATIPVLFVCLYVLGIPYEVCGWQLIFVFLYCAAFLSVVLISSIAKDWDVIHETSYLLSTESKPTDDQAKKLKAFIDWVNLEAPIEERCNDRFDHSITAATLFGLVSRKDSPKGICIFGDYGSGKTTTIKLLQEKLQKERPNEYMVVRISAWNLEPAAFPRVVLDTIVRELRLRCDVMGLNPLAMQYMMTFQEVHPLVRLVCHLLYQDFQDPEGGLREIRNILQRLSLRLVLVFEDIDRVVKPDCLEDTCWGFISYLHESALSDQIFVVTIGNKVRHNDPTLRLFPERIFINSPALEAVYQHLDMLAFLARTEKVETGHGEFPVVIPGVFVDVQDSLVFGEVRYHVAHALAGQQVRTMKAIFKSFCSVWNEIPGEVNPSELLLLSAIKGISESAVGNRSDSSGEVYSNINELVSRGGLFAPVMNNSSDLDRVVKELFKKAKSAKQPYLGELVTHLIPTVTNGNKLQIADVRRKQSILNGKSSASTPGTKLSSNYWLRMRTYTIPDSEYRDQDYFIKAMGLNSLRKLNGEMAIDDSQVNEFIDLSLEDEGFVQRFDEFGFSIGPLAARQALRVLVSQEYLCAKENRSARHQGLSVYWEFGPQGRRYSAFLYFLLKELKAGIYVSDGHFARVDPSLLEDAHAYVMEQALSILDQSLGFSIRLLILYLECFDHQSMTPNNTYATDTWVTLADSIVGRNGLPRISVNRAFEPLSFLCLNHLLNNVSDDVELMKILGKTLADNVDGSLGGQITSARHKCLSSAVSLVTGDAVTMQGCVFDHLKVELMGVDGVRLCEALASLQDKDVPIYPDQSYPSTLRINQTIKNAILGSRQYLDDLKRKNSASS